MKNKQLSEQEDQPRWGEWTEPCPLVSPEIYKWNIHFKRKGIKTRVKFVKVNGNRMQILEIFRRWWVTRHGRRLLKDEMEKQNER